MEWKNLEIGDEIYYRITDDLGYTKEITDFHGFVVDKEIDHLIIKSDLVITPEDKRDYSIRNWVDNDFWDIYEIQSIIRKGATI